MRHYWKYIKPYLPFFIFGPLLMLTEVLGEIVLPKIMSGMINVGIPNADTAYILERAGMMLGFIALMIFGGVGGHYLSIRASVYFSADLRKDLFEKVQRFSFKNIDDFSTGSLVTRLTNDITQMQNLIRMSLIMAMRAPGMLIGGLIMAISINIELAKILIYIIPCLLVAIIIVLRVGFPRFGKMQRKLDALNSGIQENITNVRVVKSFVREKFEIEKFTKSNTDLMDTTLSALGVVVFAMPIMMLAMNLTTLLVVWNGGKLVINGGMQVGDLTAFTTYIVQILMSLMMLSMIIMQSSRAMASSRRITEILDTTVDLTDDAAKRKDAVIEKGGIEFRNVYFKYYPNREENILENISFKIEPGETVGIIGTTGSGKTTLVQLIPRLYDVTEGAVLIDGVDVRDYGLEHLRTAVGMVLQKNVLFSGTIRENLKWGDEQAEDEEIYAAAESAQANDFVRSFTEGYETELGQGGVNVSGGQKQRLCIARALLKKPKILILDDSTSAVDTATEAKIREAFRTSLKDSTKIIISQRINSVIDADKILVLEDGKISGMGTHEELLRSNEEYREIYSSQTDIKEVS